MTSVDQKWRRGLAHLRASDRARREESPGPVPKRLPASATITTSHDEVVTEKCARRAHHFLFVLLPECLVSFFSRRSTTFEFFEDFPARPDFARAAFEPPALRVTK
eukprot:Polyplicarium_translucidae@DN1988_c0_g1_i3.p3